MDAIYRFIASELDATITHGPEVGSRFAPGYYSGSDNMRMRGALRFTSPPCDNTGSRFQHAGSPLEFPDIRWLGGRSRSTAALLGPAPDDDMPLRKSHLYSSLWKSCDELRGGMDKWMASIEGAIGKEVERLTGGLVDRVREMEGRYADALPELEHRVEDYSAKVEGHLRRMGLPA